jgi:TrmH family RNA methyltransferase
MKEHSFDRITFCLVRPENPGNIGSAARAMKNMGFSRLALVSSSDPRGEEATRLAYRSHEVLHSASLYPDLGSALSGAQWIVGFSGRKGKSGRPNESIETVVSEIWERAEKNQVTLLFGPEGTGLTNEELSRCHRIVFIPTGAAYASLNLAQAVLAAAYTLFRSQNDLTPPPSKRILASTKEIAPLFAEMESTLEKIGFLKSPAKKEMSRKLRTLLTRAELDEQEVKILRAMFRQVLWSAGRNSER